LSSSYSAAPQKPCRHDSRRCPSSLDPLEASFFATQEEVEKKAPDIYQRSPEEAEAFLTDHTRECMEKVVDLYRKLRNQLITKGTNNHEWL
jgi:dipeptidase